MPAAKLAAFASTAASAAAASAVAARSTRYRTRRRRHPAGTSSACHTTPALPRAAYIHIPFCRQRCGYCDFPIQLIGTRSATAATTRFHQYTATIIREIRAMRRGLAAQPDNVPRLDSVYFGGGTPSLMPPECIAEIMHEVAQAFGLNHEVEVTLEMDPGTFHEHKARGFKAAGVNRASVGAQSFDDALLAKCGRTHTVTDIYQAVTDLRNAGIDDFSIDLISGLPGQTMPVWEYSLEQVLLLRPNHVSCYDLVIEADTRFGKIYRPGEAPLPAENLAADMYSTAVRTLTNSGRFVHYEVSNFAQTHHKKSIHNQAYWHNQPYYGFGLGATSYVDNKRVSRPRTYTKYAAWVDEFEAQPRPGSFPETTQATIQDQLEDTVMLGLRLVDGLSLNTIRTKFGLPVATQLCNTLAKFPEFVHVTDTTAKLKDPEGFLLSNTILATLLADIETD